jgi:rhodanese-related sulfurtransferase
MSRPVDRRAVQRFLHDGVPIVEVLPQREYDHEHLPGAINIPTAQLEQRATAGLARQEPVVVYCYDGT